MIPVKALPYEVTIDVKRINSSDDQWVTTVDFEHAYSAADVITQVELRYKHDDRYEKAIVTGVKPRHRQP